jgi:hypothetical protein
MNLGYVCVHSIPNVCREVRREAVNGLGAPRCIELCTTGIEVRSVSGN